MSTLRAFELIPSLDRRQLDEKTISTLELSGSTLYVGTEDGFILEFSLSEGQNERGKTVVRTSKVNAKELPTRSPVTFVRSCSALNRLLVLCDGVLSVLSVPDLAILPLAGSSKLKGVSACCVNENPRDEDPFSVQVCLGKKKTLVVIKISEEKLVVEKIRDVPDTVAEVAMDGNFVCAALASHYVVCNIETGACQDLFPYDENASAVVARVSKEEFLLNAPGDLGMFVTSAGVSERPPIQWSKPAQKFVFCQPYVVAMSDDSIVVYSALDQQAKQTLHYSGGIALGNFDGKILVASSSAVYSVLPIPAETQIQALLERGKVEEALDLAETCQHKGQHNDRFQAVLNLVRQRAAFIYFQKMELERARELFIRGKIDPREVISLYPRLMPKSSAFVRAVPPLHTLADINAVSKADPEKSEELNEFLKDLLEFIRASEGETCEHKLDIDTALIKLYAKKDPSRLNTYLVTCPDLRFEAEDCQESLERLGRHHAVGLLLQRDGKHEAALEVWAALAKGDRTDDTFPGLEFLVKAIMRSPESCIWRFADFVLERDQEVGVRIFMQPPSGETRPVEWDEKVLNLVQRYPEAHVTYLEHVVLENDSQVEKYHTQLASTYLDRMQALDRLQGNLDEVQQRSRKELAVKFESLIVSSKLAKTSYLLSRIDKTELHQEKAILYGKMGDHPKALRILVHNLGDHQAAERYCDRISEGKEERARQELFLSLFKTYLEAKPGENQSPVYFEELAKDLANRRAFDFRPAALVAAMPPQWNLKSIHEALKKVGMKSKKDSHEARITAELSKGDYTNLQMENMMFSKMCFRLTENDYCMVCKKNFKSMSTDLKLRRYPNGVICCYECGKEDSVCPVTGTVFKTKLDS